MIKLLHKFIIFNSTIADSYTRPILNFILNGSSANDSVVFSFHKKWEFYDQKTGDYKPKNFSQFMINLKNRRKTRSELTNLQKNSESYNTEINFLEIKNNIETNDSITELNNPQDTKTIIKNTKEYTKKFFFFTHKREIHTSTKELNLIKNNNIERLSHVNKKSKIGEFLNTIKDLINDPKQDDDEKKRYNQLLIENSWISIIEKKLNDEKYLLNCHQNFLYNHIRKAKETLDIMAENNLLKKKFPELGNELNKIDFLILAFTLSLSLYSWNSYNYIAIKLGKEILYLNYKLKFKIIKSNSDSNSNINKSFEIYKNELNLKSETEFYIKLGDFYLTIFQQFPHDILIRKFNLKSFFSGEPYALEINKEYLDEIKNNLIINPNTLPMICKPNEWSELKFGGYLLNESKCEDIITSNKDFGHKISNKENLYKTVNILNSIKFSINSKLLDFLLSDEGAYILDKIEAENKLQREITLNIAQIYKNTFFYLNTNTDWRGRIYTQSFYISYQAGDLSSALLNFWEGAPLTEEGKFYFYIYGANSHNENSISKDSFENRLNWVKTNYNKIINLDRDLILSAENPFIFTAFCLNMRDIHNDSNFIIKTPIFLDATCSGIQHLAGLMKDLELGTHTNLIESTYENKPEDLYTMLLKPINEAINNFGLKFPEFIELSNVKLTRKEVKTSIMTKVYNVTTYGISQQLQSKLKLIFDNVDKVEEEKIFNDKFENKPIILLEQKLKESLKKQKSLFLCPGKNDKEVKLTQKDIYKIAQIINDQIFVCFPSLNNIYNYFINVSKITSKIGIPLNWITPAGLEITQHYLKRKKKIIKVSLLGKTKKFVLRENENKLDTSKQNQAIIPNIIHSLDASHLINLIKTASENNLSPIITIHDCFGTLPNKMAELEHLVKKEFILIYSDSKFLDNFHKRFIQNLIDNQFVIIEYKGKSYIKLSPQNKIEIPKIPKIGELDISNIINSKYIIS